MPVVEDTIEARRARRMAALKKVAGIWSQRPDIPADGLEYVRAPYELKTVSTVSVVNVDPPGETPNPPRSGRPAVKRVN
jgi:hypothetical protein